jgi:hypothetical protein
MYEPSWTDVATIFGIIIGTFAVGAAILAGVLSWLCHLTDNGWRRWDTIGVTTLIVVVLFSWAGIRWYGQYRNFVVAQRLHDAKFGGMFAPQGFPHGTIACTGYVVDGKRIFTIAVKNPAVVYVDVGKTGKLTAVYPAHIMPGCFPGIAGEARKPTSSEKKTYAQLLAKIEKPGLVKATEREFGSHMFP